MNWLLPPVDLLLGPGEVHVWRAALDLAPSAVARLVPLLCDEERQRGDRFIRGELTRRFIAAHAMTRDVLSRYLRCDPETLHFSRGAHGKPFLQDARGLRFNLSHSHERALLAVCRDREVGVDLEWIRDDVTREGIAQRFFSPHEVGALTALPPAWQAAGFFNCWTRKEAYLKALGSGLAIALDRFDVSLAPHEPARLLADRGNADLERWDLTALDPGEGYAGALVVETPLTGLHLWQWTPQL